MPIESLLEPFVERFNPLSRMERGDCSMAECRRAANEGLTQLFDEYARAEPAAPREIDLAIPYGQREILIRLYLPESPSMVPVHIYLHGGSWWVGDRCFGDQVCREIVNQLGTAAISLGYSLAPESKFPAALEDSYHLIKWVFEHSQAYGFDRHRISIGGTSAGANIAAATTLLIDEQGGPKLCGQLLECPALDAGMTRPSIKQFAEGYLLTEEALQEGWGFYLNKGDRSNSFASPLLAEDLSGLPTALIISAEYDPLRDEAEEYADRLRTAGVAVVQQRFVGMVHGFTSLTELLPQARECHQLMMNTLREWYGKI